MLRLDLVEVAFIRAFRDRPFLIDHAKETGGLIFQQ